MARTRCFNPGEVMAWSNAVVWCTAIICATVLFYRLIPEAWAAEHRRQAKIDEIDDQIAELDRKLDCSVITLRP
jgi:hypothetical protein